MLLVAAGLVKAQTLPEFSNGDTEHWYYIVFTTGDCVLGDNGVGRNATTKTFAPGTELQMWKLVGDADDFKIYSKLGNTAYFDKYLKTGETAGSFSLVGSTVADYASCWEIAINDKDDGWNRLNQWGGAGTGYGIGGYTPGDPNNAITFLAVEEAPDPVPALEKVKEFAVKGNESYRPEHRHTLWYSSPATSMSVSNQWMEYALPIGNGEFGAMIFGGVNREEVQFNDKSLWTGSSTKRGCYQNFGNLYIEDISGIFGDTDDKAVTGYMRNLDMTEAKANVEYTSPDGTVIYTREYISSYPDKVVAIRLAASKPGSISVRLRLYNGIKKGFVRAEYAADGTAEFEGKLNLVDFKARIKAVPVGGTMTAGKNEIEVVGADELLVILGGATNFDQHSVTYLSDAAAMRDMVDSRVDAAAAKGWDAILADHLADFKTYFDRAELSISGAENALSTQTLVTNYNNKRKYKPTAPASLMLEELYYTFGRYLLISCSRGMDTPANLQGIWNNSDRPAWQCDIHSNINVQMNYWPAEVTNLSEMHMPYLNYIYSMALEHKEWSEYARRSGQSEGWTCFTQNNIFGHSDYAENYVIANAWYSYHLWQHYLYTLDREFLKTRALPVMVSCAKFWMERLVKDEDGTWVAPQEWSPEHGPTAEDATAHAQQIVAELFKTTLEAVSILGDDAEGVDETFVAELTDKYANLDKGLAVETYTGLWGATLNGIETGTEILREWKTSTYDAGEKDHRHQSHLMAMFPFDQITPESEWFAPAVNSLQMRGDLSTGWSLGWRINLWARALDGVHAHTVLKTALRHATSYEQTSGGGGIYYNLFDSHAPFQIDGNFGYTAGVTEMLLQSYGGTLRFLPALPAEIWQSGYLKGIRAVGNFEVDQAWENGALTTATVTSGSGRDCDIRYKAIATAIVTDDTGNEVTFTTLDNDHISFPTVAGGRYTIAMPDKSGVENIQVSQSQITVENNIATVNSDEAVMTAYDIQGRAVASSTEPRLDLSAFHNAILIVKAVTPDATIARKVIVK